MAIAKIKAGDQVQVIAGKDKGKVGKVVRVIESGKRIIVEGVNKQKRNIKPRYRGESGQTVEMDGPIAISNVMLFDEKESKRTRVGTKIAGDNRVRIAKRTGNEI